MTLAIISVLIWALMLIFDTEEYIHMRKKWGEACKTYIVVDTAFLILAIYVAYQIWICN